ncbi:NepR family anti-sigma factor [Methylocapsa aurea]|uniref:NepR family anti-sigma factor n=1 Tax=Methylocapsa aurea TaxID=663610 RepID=UPI0012EB4CE5|nr:NepR family anti-sigma factor [Methylocapsa aurea]
MLLGDVHAMTVIGGMMKDDESQCKGRPVTKRTKLGKALIKGGTVRSTKTTDMEYAALKFQDLAEASVIAEPRLKKTSPKCDLAEQIGLGLRSVYDDILAQPVPDRFFDLLRQLESVSGAHSKKDAP